MGVGLLEGFAAMLMAAQLVLGSHELLRSRMMHPKMYIHSVNIQNTK